jgi:proteic killer suppression protein
MTEYIVQITKKAQRDLEKVPVLIAKKLDKWIKFVEHHGLSGAQKYTSYRNEKLFGKRQGQYSIRLNRSYRAFYKIDTRQGWGRIEIIKIIEVNHHDY